MDNNLNETPQSGGSRKRSVRGGETSSNRATRREEIRRAQQRQRTFVIVGILGAIAILLIILIPTFAGGTTSTADQPVGEFIRITPEAYPNVDGYKMGNPNAKVKIEVWEDFMCVACKQYSQNVEPRVLKELVETGQVYYIMYQFPFIGQSMGTRDSINAANAALCAADQNLYWQYKQILFANSNEKANDYTDARLKAFAEAIGMDMGKFNSCYSTAEHQDVVDQQKAMGAQYNVNGTPSLFVNGVQVSPGKVPAFEDIAIAVANASK
jgi:protein-disulfide isomerase